MSLTEEQLREAKTILKMRGDVARAIESLQSDLRCIGNFEHPHRDLALQFLPAKIAGFIKLVEATNAESARLMELIDDS